MRLPEAPVMLMVAVPVAAAADVARVSKLVLVVGLVAKEAVTPLGRPDAESVTLPENPLAGVTAMVVFPEPPWVTVTLEGEAEIVKSGTGAEPGQLLTRLATLMEPIPVAKSQPVVVP